jgi:Aromatic acid exporter family member 1
MPRTPTAHPVEDRLARQSHVVVDASRTLWTAVRHRGEHRDTALLLAKAALATVVAWQLAVRVLDSPNPFYAPMAALLVVDRTMVRSLGASAQRVAAVVVGMGVAWLVGSLAGVHWWSMLPVIYLALLIGRWRRLGDHGVQVPTMVLLSLLTVGGTDTEFTYLTVVETVVGGAVGVLTNAVVLAPLHLREPREQIRSLAGRVCALLNDIAAGMRGGWDEDTARGWYDASTDIIQAAPRIHREIETGRESMRLNPRRNLTGVEVDWAGYARAADALRRTQWQVSGIARTLVDAAAGVGEGPAPSPGFLQRYADALDDVAGAIGHFGIADEQERAVVADHLCSAWRTVHEAGDQVRASAPDDTGAWSAHGALLLDAERLVRGLQAANEQAVMPTDSGPVRRPRRLVGR